MSKACLTSQLMQRLLHATGSPVSHSLEEMCRSLCMSCEQPEALGMLKGQDAAGVTCRNV